MDDQVLARQLGNLAGGLWRPGTRSAAAGGGCGWAPGARPPAGGSWPGSHGDPVAGSSSVPWCSMSSCRWTEPELAHQLGGSWPGACGGPVPVRRQPVAGADVTPELARQLGGSWPGGLRRPRRAGSRSAVVRVGAKTGICR